MSLFEPEVRSLKIRGYLRGNSRSRRRIYRTLPSGSRWGSEAEGPTYRRYSPGLLNWGSMGIAVDPPFGIYRGKEVGGLDLSHDVEERCLGAYSDASEARVAWA